jgi:6-phosphofructokinase 1
MDESARERASLALARLNARHVGHTWQLSRKLEALTGLEARITILGYVQRGGSPTAADRLLATQLGTRCIESLEAGHSGVMVAVQGDSMVPVPLRDVAGTVKLVPPDHPWLASARRVGTCLGA